MTEPKGAGTPGPNVSKGGRVRYTPAQKDLFLAELATSCNVRLSAGTAQMSMAGLYRLRRSSIAFRREWAAALAEGYERLELVMLERAIGGDERRIEREGIVTVVREYPDRVAITLYQAHRQSVLAWRGREDRSGEGAVARAKLSRQLKALNRALAATLPDAD